MDTEENGWKKSDIAFIVGFFIFWSVVTYLFNFID